VEAALAQISDVERHHAAEDLEATAGLMLNHADVSVTPFWKLMISAPSRPYRAICRAVLPCARS
jgi:hypothetical protein